jgi:hypothetical protein
MSATLPDVSARRRTNCVGGCKALQRLSQDGVDVVDEFLHF